MTFKFEFHTFKILTKILSFIKQPKVILKNGTVYAEWSPMKKITK